ncbi:RNA polymerase sigma-70 factor [Botryobacter ruber]|uniref:RNA polymerase sigma-70 factor n=1 Tax=Botryobacter ruber TaxID=2171629 RepID=UPI000E0A5172|nr:RNA polymerase sigma-70 factor [Botryobacter ruber]
MDSLTNSAEPAFNNTNTEVLSLEELFQKYYARLVHFAFQFTNSKESAEDFAQDAFIKYWNLKDEIATDERAIKSFLYTTVKNASLNAIRHLKVAENFMAQSGFSDIEEETVVHAIIKSEVIGELHRAIESLPESCQIVSKMGFLEGMKNHEIAQELGVSINTVKTQKKRGLQLLRSRLSPEIITLLLLLLSDQ